MQNLPSGHSLDTLPSKAPASIRAFESNAMNECQTRVLVVDDEPELRALLQRYLSDHGFTVRTVAHALSLEALLQRERFDVLVLDVTMPGEDGLSVCRRLRAMGDTIPILMLTARGDPVDRIVGLEMGADDYLPKPFNPRELLARIQAMIRRQRLLGPHGGSRAGTGSIRFGDFLLLVEERRLLRHGQDYPLTSGEFALLLALVQQAGRPLGRDRLLASAHGPGHQISDRSVDVQIMRLRKIIEIDPAHPRHIRTVWGKGYVFIADPPLPEFE